MKLRVGLVGLGSAWEQRHAPALRTLSDRYDVRAICEQVFHHAERAAEEFGAEAVDGYRALAERSDIDAIMMLSPQWCGALPIVAACEAGKAVYCGAVLDLNREAARELKQRVQQSGVAFMAELPRRHAAATLRLKELIATHLGPPRIVFAHQRVRGHIAGRNGLPGRQPPTVTEHLIELIDWCRYVVGRESQSVLSCAHRLDGGGRSDYEMISLEFAADEGQAPPVAQISCGDYIAPDWPEAITFRPPAAMQISCERGVAFIDLPATLIWFDEAGRHKESLETERPVGEQLLSQFHRAVTSLVRRSDLDDAYRALTILNAARESQTSGARVPLEFDLV
ncbi:MAG: gfo/Idh/MocA family oxidoreductase [Planctomycetota bacterium]|nr:MAG: gfo/Idh/MocA family oxidoreductase [Planctomycetota bacterium]REJ90987.1 MAG: gfo/Idh/MocA family oxidoreductase [Planctomycetota bacterium]REK25470.1 MAG: gfo/Idh/MocA family oxidoreductase [Planctomycetota bacterium]REK40826.1 MAG: gfo/Idh/MocA family oxidoreductase [Planctomycetota bacterium]